LPSSRHGVLPAPIVTTPVPPTPVMTTLCAMDGRRIVSYRQFDLRGGSLFSAVRLQSDKGRQSSKAAKVLLQEDRWSIARLRPSLLHRYMTRSWTAPRNERCSCRRRY
jgi:hypothetical protein